MSRWDDKFDAHGIHGILKTLKETMQEIMDKTNRNVEEIEESTRFAHILNYIDSNIKICDPTIVIYSALDNMSQYLNLAANDLRNYISSDNMAYMQSANTNLDSALPYISQLLLYHNTSDIEGLRESVVNFRKAISRYNRQNQDEYKETIRVNNQLKSDVTELTSVIDQQKIRLDNAINQNQVQFTNAEDTRRGQFILEEEKRQAKNTEVAEKWQTKFDTMTSEFINLQQRQEKDGRDLLIQIEDNVKGFITELEVFKERAQKLVNIIANTGMAGGYQIIANQEQKAATNWRISSVVSLLGLVSFALLGFYLTLTKEFSWAQFTGRVFVAGTFGALFAYTAKQASDHSKIERINRRVELELASIDPFLVGLPEDKQIEIRGMLGQKIFGPQDISLETSKDNFFGTPVDLVKQLLDIVHVAVKKS